MDLEQLAFDYLGVTKIAEKKKTIKKTRKGVMTRYERLREKYVVEKQAVDEIKEEGLKLQKRYESHKSKMDKYYDQMVELRKKLEEMDDSGKDFVEIEEIVDADIEEAEENL